MFIFSNNIFVGILENTTQDMWYLEGEWKPQDNEFGRNFDKMLKEQNFEKNFSDLKGILIYWKEHKNEELSVGLAFGLLNGNLVFRMLRRENVDILDKENKLIKF
jgi:hypothetical protein